MFLFFFSLLTAMVCHLIHLDHNIKYPEIYSRACIFHLYAVMHLVVCPFCLICLCKPFNHWCFCVQSVDFVRGIAQQVGQCATRTTCS